MLSLDKENSSPERSSLLYNEPSESKNWDVKIFGIAGMVLSVILFLLLNAPIKKLANDLANKPADSKAPVSVIVEVRNASSTISMPLGQAIDLLMANITQNDVYLYTEQIRLSCYVQGGTFEEPKFENGKFSTLPKCTPKQ